MDDTDKRDFIETYLKHLEWNRLPPHLPSTKTEFEQALAGITARARESPYEDDIWDLDSWTHHDPETAWEVIGAIVQRAEEADLGLFGAGDLETFVHLQAVPFADVIEKEILVNPRFRKAFESVYIGQSTPAEVGRRFNAAMRAAGVAEGCITDWWGEEPGA